MSFCHAVSQKTALKMAGTDKSREGLSTSVSQTDGAVGDAVQAGTSAQHRPHWLTSDWEESVPNPLFSLLIPFVQQIDLHPLVLFKFVR